MLNFGGGDEQFRYTMNLSYNCVAGAMKGSFRNNFNGSLTISYLLKTIRFTNTFSLGLNNSEESPYGDFYTYVSMNPYFYPYDENGQVVKSFITFGSTTGTTTLENPLWEASINKFNKEKYTNIRNTFQMEWNVLKGLKLATRVGYSSQTNRSDQFSPKYRILMPREVIRGVMERLNLGNGVLPVITGIPLDCIACLLE